MQEEEKFLISYRVYILLSLGGIFLTILSAETFSPVQIWINGASHIHVAHGTLQVYVTA